MAKNLWVPAVLQILAYHQLRTEGGALVDGQLVVDWQPMGKLLRVRKTIYVYGCGRMY